MYILFSSSSAFPFHLCLLVCFSYLIGILHLPTQASEDLACDEGINISILKALTTSQALLAARHREERLVISHPQMQAHINCTRCSERPVADILEVRSFIRHFYFVCRPKMSTKRKAGTGRCCHRNSNLMCGLVS